MIAAPAKLFTAWDEGNDKPPPQSTNNLTPSNALHGRILPKRSLNNELFN